MSTRLAITDYATALEFLLGRINYERTAAIPYASGEFKLDRMRELMRRLGNPHTRVPAVHIAGTKGKGSTACMIASVLEKAGYKTGLYTSPHLQCLEERLVINGRQCSQKELVDLVRQVEPLVEQFDNEISAGELSGLTFFEITTAMAFLYFAQQQCDIAVLEVGLGGRLDSTNICTPEVSVITTISFDHMKQLGNTLALIAREKAGILKPNVPAVSGVTNAEPREVIQQVAADVGAPLSQRAQDYHADMWAHTADETPHGFKLDYREETNHGAFELRGVQLGLLGEHQAENAATAIAALRVLGRRGWKIDESAIRAGLAAVQCPARIEIVSQRPWVIIDTAHNLASIDALCRELRSDFRAANRVLIFASSRDKDAEGMLRRLLSEFDHIVLTRYLENPRARTEDEALQIIEQLKASHAGSVPQMHLATSPAAALEVARSLTLPESLICVTGSFFLAAELRPLVMQSE